MVLDIKKASSIIHGLTSLKMQILDDIIKEHVDDNQKILFIIYNLNKDQSVKIV